jgi:hypothetical protein
MHMFLDDDAARWRVETGYWPHGILHGAQDRIPYTRLAQAQQVLDVGMPVDTVHSDVCDDHFVAQSRVGHGDHVGDRCGTGQRTAQTFGDQRLGAGYLLVHGISDGCAGETAGRGPDERTGGSISSLLTECGSGHGARHCTDRGPVIGKIGGPASAAGAE